MLKQSPTQGKGLPVRAADARPSNNAGFCKRVLIWQRIELPDSHLHRNETRKRPGQLTPERLAVVGMTTDSSHQGGLSGRPRSQPKHRFPKSPPPNGSRPQPSDGPLTYRTDRLCGYVHFGPHTVLIPAIIRVSERGRFSGTRLQVTQGSIQLASIQRPAQTLTKDL